MEKRISDMMNSFYDDSVELKHIESFSHENIKTMTMNKIRESRQEKKAVPRWRMVAAAVICCFVISITGYAAYEYFGVFQKWFNDNDETLIEELVTEENHVVENSNYRLAVESMMLDTENKKIVVSIEALNEESWKRMVECKGWLLDFSDEWDGGGSVTFLDELSGNEENRKRYYLYEISGNSNECKICFMEGTTDELSLTVPVKVNEEKYVAINPKDCRIADDLTVGQIYIYRTGIKLICSWENIETDEVENARRPQIIVETKTGKNICLLVDNREKISEEVDEMWRINNLAGGSGFYSEDGVTGIVTKSFEFVKVFDIEQIEKLWVDGVEYQID